MNVALSAVVVFLILAPGFTFRSRYRRIERTSLDYAPFGEAIIMGVVFAAVLHFFWLGAAFLFGGWVLDLAAVLRLLASEPTAQSSAIQFVGARQDLVIFYFLTILIAPFVLAPSVRFLAERKGWHLPGSRLYRLFGFDAPWYYLLRAEPEKRMVDVLVAAVVDFGGRCYVVRGFVVDFYVNPTGELDRIVLEFADRRPLEADKEAQGQDSPERYYRIEGDFFVLRYREAITLNVQYIEFKGN
jgi:hypothetical protein